MRFWFHLIGVLVLLQIPLGVFATSSFTKKEQARSLVSATAKVINEFLDALLSEAEWQELVTDFEITQGNYCHAKDRQDVDLSFKEPCLNQLDCLCKEHNFGYALNKYRNVTYQEAEEIFAVGLINRKTYDYRQFLKLMSISYFAGKISQEDLYESVLSAYHLYKTDPKKAKSNLENLIDANQIFKKKIDEIKEEKRKFEEEQGRVISQASKSMAAFIQPLNMFLGLVSFGYEYKLQDWVSLRVRISFYGAGLIAETYLSYGNEKNFSIFGGVGSKLYMLGEAIKSGVYIEPALDMGYEYVKLKNSNEAIKDIALIPSFIVGVDKVFTSGIYLDIGMGFGYHLPIVKFETAQMEYKNDFIVPRFHASVGYAW